MRKLRKASVLLATVLTVVGFLTSCGHNKEQQITCTFCNGSGQVKFYYGDGDNDYNLGPCTSCEGNGYVIVKPSGNSSFGKKVICGSCEKYVDNVVTREDAAGESRTWCSDCWKNYDNMMGR